MISSKYLDQFPPQHRQFVFNRFSQAYVFAEQSCTYGQDDVIELAQGPITMKQRVVDSCGELLPLVNEEQQQILTQIVETIEESNEFLKEVRAHVDTTWADNDRYIKEHPPTPRKKPDPPTEKQLGLLKTLGCLETPKSKAEASKLIERYKNW